VAGNARWFAGDTPGLTRPGRRGLALRGRIAADFAVTEVSSRVADTLFGGICASGTRNRKQSGHNESSCGGRRTDTIIVAMCLLRAAFVRGRSLSAAKSMFRPRAISIVFFAVALAWVVTSWGAACPGELDAASLLAPAGDLSRWGQAEDLALTESDRLDAAFAEAGEPQGPVASERPWKRLSAWAASARSGRSWMPAGHRSPSLNWVPSYLPDLEFCTVLSRFRL